MSTEHDEENKKRKVSDTGNDGDGESEKEKRDEKADDEKTKLTELFMEVWRWDAHEEAMLSDAMADLGRELFRRGLITFEPEDMRNKPIEIANKIL